MIKFVKIPDKQGKWQQGEDRYRIVPCIPAPSAQYVEAESEESAAVLLGLTAATPLPPPQPRRIAPISVTPAQIRVWLIQQFGAAILDQIDAMLDSIPDEAQRKIAKIKWEYGITVLRTDPLVVQFAQALGFDEAQMDAAFLAASQIG